MLRPSFKAAAFNISFLVLLLGGFYFLDKNIALKIFGTICIITGLLNSCFVIYTYYLGRKLKNNGSKLLLVSAGLMFLSGIFRCSLLNWEILALVTLLSVFTVLCATQLQGKTAYLPK